MLPLNKIPVIGLLLILGYSQIGYYFVILDSQYEHKEAMKQQILSSLEIRDLQVISLTDNAVKIFWEDEDDKNEFSFNGEMYDVVKTETINGKTLLYCVGDEKEQQLIDKYNSITKNNSAEDKKAKNADVSLTLFIVENSGILFSPRPAALRQYHSFDAQLTKGITNTSSPPPRA